MVRIDAARSGLASAALRAARVKVADGYEIYRRVLECGVDISPRVTPATYERRLQLPLILMIVSGVAHLCSLDI